MSGGDLVIRLESISVMYGAHRIINDMRLEFGTGITALMGHNGSGKSTLLRVCALLEPPTEGAVRFIEQGRDMDQDTTLKRRITMVLSRGGIFNATVCANTAYGLRLRGMRGRELRDRTHAALDKVGLLEKIKQNALSLSSGESQRLALARAMAIEPEVLILDEPTASVDEANTAIIEDLIAHLRRPDGPLVIMATHDRDQAERLASRVVTISKGRLLD